MSPHQQRRKEQLHAEPHLLVIVKPLATHGAFSAIVAPRLACFAFVARLHARRADQPLQTGTYMPVGNAIKGRLDYAQHGMPANMTK